MLTDGLRHAFTPGATITRTHSIPPWFRERFETAEPFARFTAFVRLLNGWMGLGVFAVFLATVGWSVAGNGSLLVYGIPIHIVVFAVVIAASVIVRLCAQLPSDAERRSARSQGARAFALGSSPATKIYMVVHPAGLTFVEGESADVAIIDWSRIDVAAVQTSKTGVGVGLSLSVDSEWFDIPIVLEVGGPVVPLWSAAVWQKDRALADAVIGCFEGRVNVHRADESRSRSFASRA